VHTAADIISVLSVFVFAVVIVAMTPKSRVMTQMLGIVKIPVHKMSGGHSEEDRSSSDSKIKPPVIPERIGIPVSIRIPGRITKPPVIGIGGVICDI
jgi:hypothetical protein